MYPKSFWVLGWGIKNFGFWVLGLGFGFRFKVWVKKFLGLGFGYKNFWVLGLGFGFWV